MLNRILAPLIVAVVGVSSAAAVENLVLSGNDRWVAVASRQNLDEAISIAQTYSAKKSRVVKSQNGWFAILLGPVATEDIASFRQGYSGPLLPSDAALTRGTGYVETVWPLSAVAARDVADNSADWANCVANPKDADSTIAGCAHIIDAGTESAARLFLAHLWRGSAYEKKGDHDQAIADFDEAIQLQPDNAMTYYNRAVANGGKGRNDVAISDYNMAIRRKPDFAEAYFNRGVAYDIKGDAARALDDYRVASQRLPASDPNHDKAVKRIADLEAKITAAARKPPALSTESRSAAAPPPPPERGLAIEASQPIAASEATTLAGASDAYQRGDFAAALMVYRPLAERGEAHAQYVLGEMYAYGQGVPKDYAVAYMWLNLAAAQSSPNVGDDGPNPGIKRDELEKLMPLDQVAEAQRLAREWKPKTQP